MSLPNLLRHRRSSVSLFPFSLSLSLSLSLSFSLSTILGRVVPKRTRIRRTQHAEKNNRTYIRIPVHSQNNSIAHRADRLDAIRFDFTLSTDRLDPRSMSSTCLNDSLPNGFDWSNALGLLHTLERILRCRSPDLFDLPSYPFFLFTLSLLLSFFLFNRIPSLDSTLDGLRLNDMISPLYSVPSSSNVYLSRFSFLFFFTLLISLSSPRLYLESLQDDAIALFPFPFVPTNLNLFIFGSFFFFLLRKRKDWKQRTKRRLGSIL